MNYKLYSLKSAFDIYKKYLYGIILYIISMFVIYHFTYDKGILTTYYITSIKLKNNIYNLDDKEFKSIYVCNVNTGDEDDKQIIWIDAYDYDIMIKNKANILTRYENGGHTPLSYIMYCISTCLILLYIILLANEPRKN